MLMELLVMLLGVLSISEVLFGGVVEGVGAMADTVLHRRLVGRPHGDSPIAAPPVAASHLMVLHAVLGAVLGLLSLLVWPQPLVGLSSAARVALPVALALLGGGLAAVVEQRRHRPLRPSRRATRFLSATAFALCVAIARAVGHAFGPT